MENLCFGPLCASATTVQLGMLTQGRVFSTCTCVRGDGETKHVHAQLHVSRGVQCTCWCALMSPEWHMWGLRATRRVHVWVSCQRLACACLHPYPKQGMSRCVHVHSQASVPWQGVCKLAPACPGVCVCVCTLTHTCLGERELCMGACTCVTGGCVGARGASWPRIPPACASPAEALAATAFGLSCPRLFLETSDLGVLPGAESKQRPQARAEPPGLSCPALPRPQGPCHAAQPCQGTASAHRPAPPAHAKGTEVRPSACPSPAWGVAGPRSLGTWDAWLPGCRLQAEAPCGMVAPALAWSLCSWEPSSNAEEQQLRHRDRERWAPRAR